MEGRIGVAEFVPFDTKFPILLPREHIISYRLIEFYHQRYGHANKDTVYNELRQRFSIPNLRAGVAFVMKNCQWCKVRKTQPQTPRMAPLPVERLTPFTKPFSYVGIDYFGPIDVTVGRRTEKKVGSPIYLPEYSGYTSGGRISFEHRILHYGYTSFCSSERATNCDIFR